MSDYFQVNRKLWDEFAIAHERSTFYGVQAFKDGRNSLNQHEIDELGDVEGKTLVHLMCHIGLDTMSWERLGARPVGIDFSPRSIEIATDLASELGLGSVFVEADVYDAPKVLEGDRFDVVYTSHGVLAWLPDLAGWARVIADLLEPGGTFYLSELHPYSLTLANGDEGPTARYPYFGVGATEQSTTEYQEFPVPEDPSQRSVAQVETATNFQWQHTLGDVISALSAAGLVIEFVHEWPFALYRRLNGMEQDENGNWRLPGLGLPFLFSIRAHLSSRITAE